MSNQTIRYSIIVCSYNGGQTISECLASLLAQNLTSDQYEILVIDDGSRDRVSNIAQVAFGDSPNCRLIQFDHNKGLSAARNAGWKKACGEIVLYIDDDAVADGDWLERTVQAYTDPQIAGAGGLMRPYQHDMFADYEIGLQALTYGSHAEHLNGAGGNNMSFRRTILDQIGGFDERFIAVADDADINRRLIDAGYKLVVLPDVTVRHHLPTSYRQFWKKKIGRGKGSHLFQEKYGLPHSSIRCLVKIGFYSLWLPSHILIGYKLGYIIQKPKQFLKFALLSWLDRVGNAYGEYIQSRKSSK